MHTHTRTYVRTHTDICTPIRTHTHTYTHTYIRTHTHTYTHTYTYTHIHTHTHTYTYTHTYIMYVHTHIHTYTHTYTHIHTYVHTYIHTYTHVHIYEHTHYFAQQSCSVSVTHPPVVRAAGCTLLLLLCDAECADLQGSGRSPRVQLVKGTCTCRQSERCSGLPLIWPPLGPIKLCPHFKGRTFLLIHENLTTSSFQRYGNLKLNSLQSGPLKYGHLCI